MKVKYRGQTVKYQYWVLDIRNNYMIVNKYFIFELGKGIFSAKI